MWPFWVARNLRMVSTQRAMSLGSRYSDYYKQLEESVKNRYTDKMDYPYTFSSGNSESNNYYCEYPDKNNILD